MNELNPAAIFNDFKSGKLGKSSFIALIRNKQSVDFLLELYQLLEVNRSEEAENLKHLMEETLGKEYLIYYDLIPKEAMALELLGKICCESISYSRVDEWNFRYIQTKNGLVEKITIEGIFNTITSTFLELFSGLKELALDDCNITDYSNLSNLTSLRLSGTEDPYIYEMDELHGLDKLVNLKELDLSRNYISEIKHLDNLINLKKLNFSSNRIKEIRGLQNLTQLEYLNLEGNEIDELKGLDNLRNLKELNLSNNIEIQNIKNLENLTELESLKLENNYLIDEIKGLDNLINLRVLNLHKDKYMTDESGYELLLNTRSLLNTDFWLKVHNIEDEHEKHLFMQKTIMCLEGYKNAENIKQIEKYRTYITEIKGLDRLTNLEELDLTGNQITEIKGLEMLINLKKLSLDNNLISEIKGLENNVNLIFLGLFNNRFNPIPELGPLNREGFSVREPQYYIKYCQNMVLKQMELEGNTN